MNLLGTCTRCGAAALWRGSAESVYCTDCANEGCVRVAVALYKEAPLDRRVHYRTRAVPAAVAGASVRPGLAEDSKLRSHRRPVWCAAHLARSTRRQRVFVRGTGSPSVPRWLVTLTHTLITLVVLCGTITLLAQFGLLDDPATDYHPSGFNVAEGRAR